jgi:hypothetical protein
MPGAHRRKRGSRSTDTDRLRREYELLTRGARPNRHPHAGDLHVATGDPLALDYPARAAEVWDVAGAPRPQVHIRRLAASVWGETLDLIVDLAHHLAARNRWSALRASEEAVVIAARRGRWLGAPVSFDKAAETVRKRIGRPAARTAMDGATGARMRVKPAPGLAVRDPATMELLPAEGADVPDDVFWRRRLRDGDVVPGDQ